MKEIHYTWKQLLSFFFYDTILSILIATFGILLGIILVILFPSFMMGVLFFAILFWIISKSLE